MPLVTRARAAALLLAAGVLAGLTGCAAPVPAAAPAAAGAVAVVEHDRAEVRAQIAQARPRFVDDRATASVAVLPRRSNGVLVVFVHGWSQDRYSLLDRPASAPVLRALLDAGYTVATADGALKAWGDPASVTDYRRVMEAAQRRYHLHDVVLIGESMGGLAAMQLARTLPQVRAVVAWYPVCDLRTMTQKRFAESIVRSWSGRQRAAVSPVAVSAKPLMVWASPHDTTVVAGRNAAVCVAEARRAGAPVVYHRSRGEHGDRSNFQPRAVVRFFDAHRSRAA